MSRFYLATWLLFFAIGGDPIFHFVVFFFGGECVRVHTADEGAAAGGGGTKRRGRSSSDPPKGNTKGNGVTKKSHFFVDLPTTSMGGLFDGGDDGHVDNNTDSQLTTSLRSPSPPKANVADGNRRAESPCPSPAVTLAARSGGGRGGGSGTCQFDNNDHDDPMSSSQVHHVVDGPMLTRQTVAWTQPEQQNLHAFYIRVTEVPPSPVANRSFPSAQRLPPVEGNQFLNSCGSYAGSHSRPSSAASSAASSPDNSPFNSAASSPCNSAPGSPTQSMLSAAFSSAPSQTSSRYSLPLHSQFTRTGDSTGNTGSPHTREGGVTYFRLEETSILRPNCFGDLYTDVRDDDDAYRHLRKIAKSSEVFGMDDTARGVTGTTKNVVFSQTHKVVLEDPHTADLLTVPYIKGHCKSRYSCLGVRRNGTLTRNLTKRPVRFWKKHRKLNGIVALIDFSHFATGMNRRLLGGNQFLFACSGREFAINLSQNAVNIYPAHKYANAIPGPNIFLPEEADGSLTVLPDGFWMDDGRKDRVARTNNWLVMGIQEGADSNIGGPLISSYPMVCRIRLRRRQRRHAISIFDSTKTAPSKPDPKIQIHLRRRNRCVAFVGGAFSDNFFHNHPKFSCDKGAVSGDVPKDSQGGTPILAFAKFNENGEDDTKPLLMLNVKPLPSHCFDQLPFPSPKESPSEHPAYALSQRAKVIDPPNEPPPPTGEPRHKRGKKQQTNIRTTV